MAGLPSIFSGYWDPFFRVFRACDETGTVIFCHIGSGTKILTTFDDAPQSVSVLFETDYPHGDSTFPHSKKAAEEQFGHLPQPVVDRIARGNMIRLRGLDHLDPDPDPSAILS